MAEKIVLLTPVYNIFFNSIVNNGRNVVECPLTYDGESYGVDFEKLERVLADPQTTMLIFCNAHNPKNMGKGNDGADRGALLETSCGSHFR